MKITISTKGLGGAKLADLGILFNTPRGKTGMNAAGGRAVQSFLRKYHREYGRAKKWENPNLPTHGRGRKSTRFASKVAVGWQKPVSTTRSTEVTNLDPRLSHKITGGIIKAQSGKYLTIPVRPDAHGKTVAEYEAQYANRKRWTAKKPRSVRGGLGGGLLFRPRGKDYLAYKQANGNLQVVYLLKPQITQAPWPNAMPSDERIFNAWWYKGVEPKVEDAIRRLGVKAGTDK